MEYESMVAVMYDYPNNKYINLNISLAIKDNFAFLTLIIVL